MYEIRPESVKTFVEDNSIKLPRFQRKQTWDDKKNFELCISIFKEYPMGVCILNLEKQNGVETKWLLDGRQRRNALATIWDDPEQIYIWAKKWLKLKNNDQLADVEEKFWESINDYLEEDVVENENNEIDSDLNDENNEDLDDSLSSDEEEEFNLNSSGLEFLLEIIKLIHNKTTKFSGFTRPFDFTKLIKRLPYETTVNGKRTLTSKKLKSFINQYETYCKDELLDLNSKVSFESFMFQRFDLDSSTKQSLKAQITQNWDNIYARIDILNKIRNILIGAKIGLIEVKDIASTDSQKIFNIINSKGTKLNAVEILSAKPSWNIIIKNPTQKQIVATKELYTKIEVRYENIVKWDLPATFLSVIQNGSSFFKEFTDSKADFEKQLTLGFKLVSGLIQGGVKKEDIDDLSRNKDINWEVDIENLANEVDLFSKIILSNEYFKYFKSWKVSIMDLLTDAITLNFVIILYKDWVRKGKPVGSDTKAKQFQKNSFILIDQLIFEYVNKQWRGSSDSKIAKNLNNFGGLPELFEPITKARWRTLLNEIIDSNSIDSDKITQKMMEPILYHFYCISKIQGPDSFYKIEVDHIIPQSIFNKSALRDRDSLQHNLYNLALLPKDDNISKSSKRLVEISNQWLKDQIEKYAFIKENQFTTFSELNNLEQLKNLRGNMILDAFDKKRDSILNN
ncbi:DUF262 domain-containing protein [Frigoriflavimonas asaccharolytica]|uniref:GmrSD restriction endonucleases N-terminal domain-containing protein n=1 Tax=Frigoriflavimonas asaccharolytica TaxID=2735899 RepID=A0A8J8K7B4_9FLAO|nr:DUF262 domain-containing protein [Frigoriflavimonas asaccharolytica]NRS91803.1 hypothetical protein [Frigoriflavimonas asaccharolytica]